jgi:hypothetical protein
MSNELAHEVVRQLDTTDWQEGLISPQVQVYYSRELPAPVVGYRTVTEHDARPEELFGFLGTDMLEAFSKLNRRFLFAEQLQAEPRVVRTGFSMPPGFSSREFLHLLVCTQLDERVWVVAYGPVGDESLFPVVRNGFIRCPMYPSGQRITVTGGGRTRVEHLMVYELGGWISHRLQNSVFHAGHLRAYHDEWLGLVQRFGTAQ